MRKSLLSFLILTVLVSWALCTFAGGGENPGRDAADKLLSVGQTATIRLEANRTTGYMWHYSIKNKDIIKVVNDAYRESRKDGVLGAGGRRVIQIKAIKKGVTVVNFGYYRQWQPEPVEKTRRITVKVVSNSSSGFFRGCR